jgi:thioredoxin-related protein
MFNDHRGIQRLLFSFALSLTIATADAAGGGPAAFDDGARADVVHPDWFQDSFLDLADDLKRARQAGKTGILVFFSTRTCAYCQRFLDTSFADADIVARVRRRFDVIGIEVLSDAEVTDVNGRRHWAKDFAVQEQARFTPTLIFYGADGEPLARLVGHYPPERFRPVLDYLEEGRYAQQTLREYLAARAAQPAPDGGTIRRSELFAPPPHRLNRHAPGGRPLFVLFERSGCADCARLHQTVLTDRAIRARLREFQAVQLDMADDRGRLLSPEGDTLSPKAWADRLGVIHAPTLVFFDENGKEVVRLDTEAGRYRLDGALQYVLEKGYIEQPQFQRWRRAQAGGL